MRNPLLPVRLRRSRLGAASLCGALLLAACGAAEQQSPAASPSPSPSRQPASTAAASAVVDPLPSSRYRVLSSVAAGRGEQSAGVAAIDSDGDRLVERAFASTDKSELLGTEKLTVIGSDGVKQTVPTQDRSGHFQVIHTALSRRWVVWQETEGTNVGGDPWTMYAYNRASHSVAKLATWPTPADGDPLRDAVDYPPVIVGSTVYWIAMTGTAKVAHANLYGCELGACAPKLYAKDAAFVSTDGRAVFAVAYKAYGSSGMSAARVLTVDDGHARTAATVGLGAPTDLWGFAVNSTHYMLLTHAGRAEMITASRSSEKVDRTIVGQKEATFSYPIATDTYLAWSQGSEGSPTFAGGYMLVGGKQYLAGDAATLGPGVGAGRYLVWADAKDPHAAVPKSIDRIALITG